MNSKICTNKACEHAGAQQDHNQFCKDLSKPSGTRSWCKSCNIVSSRKDWAEEIQKESVYHACYLALIKPVMDSAIALLISECVALDARRGPVMNKKEIIAENSLMIFKLGLIK